MNIRIGFGLLILGVGCSETTVEPIRAASLAITSVEIEPEESSDPYACKVAPIDPSAPPEPPPPSVRESSIPSATVPVEDAPLEGLQPFLRLGDLLYAGTCQSKAPGASSQCWYTGDVSCDQEEGDCGGFVGSLDPVTGDYQVTGGQHMVCASPCVADEECPAAGTGTARPACMHAPEFNPVTESGQCMLACDNGETCPDGFICVDPGVTFVSSDGTQTPAPAQCVQFHRLTLSSDPWPR